MRVTTTKSKTDESFYINYAFINEKGKSTSRIYKKLGKLSELSKKLNTDRDGVMAWAKEQARIETEKYKKENDGEYDTDSIVGVVCEHLESEGYMYDYISEDVAIEF